MKLFKISPIVAAFMAMPALAAPDVVIYAAGASAQLATLSNIVTKLCVNTAADQVEFFQGFTSATSRNTNLRAYRCTPIAEVGFPAATKVVFAYSAIGGSASGVQYVARGGQRTFLNFAACPATPSTASTNATTDPETPAGSKKFNCNITAAGLTAQQIPVAGSSDVEPARFIGDNVPSGETAMDGADILALTVKNSRATIFGLVANDKMWLALQKKQGIVAASATAPIMPVATTTVSATNGLTNATTPGFTDAQRPSLRSFEYQAVAQGQIDNLSKLGLAAGPVQLARRVNGSGTQAISNITFLNNPCGNEIGAQLTPATKDDGGGDLTITEGSSTSDVIKAIQESPTAAIGVISLENPERAAYTLVATATNSDVTPKAPIGFIKLDGFAANRPNAIAGDYKFYAEETFQWNTAAVTAEPLKLAFLELFATKSGEVTTLQTLSTATQVGVAALTGPNGLPSTNPTFILKGDRTGNNCKPATRIIE